MDKTIEGLEEKYDLELEKVVAEITKNKAKLVLLQFPDGLKPYATSVVDFLREKTKASPLGVHQNSESGCKFLIWMGSCFGACDTPVLDTAQCIPQGHENLSEAPNCGMKGQGLEKQIDLVIQFGHNELMPDY